MITKEQALTLEYFHKDPVQLITKKCSTWRRNGKTQVWKRSLERFRIPIKYGLYIYGAITEQNSFQFHSIDNCPYTKNSDR